MPDPLHRVMKSLTDHSKQIKPMPSTVTHYLCVLKDHYCAINSPIAGIYVGPTWYKNHTIDQYPRSTEELGDCDVTMITDSTNTDVCIMAVCLAAATYADIQADTTIEILYAEPRYQDPNQIYNQLRYDPNP